MVAKITIVPPAMANIVATAGYVPAVQADNLVFCAGQVGRRSDLSVILDPERQFEACWENLRLVLEAAGCSFEDVVDMTTFHVGMRDHMAVFRQVKDRFFPRSTCAWTCIGVTELAVPGLLVEIKCVAMKPLGSDDGAIASISGAE